MQHLKKSSLFAVIIFIFLFFTPISFAVPGQLIYNMGAQVDNSQCINDLSTCNSLYGECQLQKTQQEKTSTTLTNDLDQERKKTLILELTLTAVVVSFTIAFIFLKKNYRQ